MAPRFNQETDESKPLLRSVITPRCASRMPLWRAVCAGSLLCAAMLTATLLLASAPDTQDNELLQCAWPRLQEHVSLLSVPAIQKAEFLSRQQRLAAALQDEGVDAFITEPSASSTYYTNVSSEYDLSERPFLIIVDKHGNFSYLVPSFEAGRIAALDMVYDTKTVIQWDETESPYEVLKKHTKYTRVMMDEHARFMIAAGLSQAGIAVVPMSQTVQKLRAVKQESEVVILRAINHFTLELVRALQPCIAVGVTQELVTETAKELFTRAGVGSGFWAIVLFGDQASFPHGGKHGKTLEEGEFVLIDIGSKLHGYGSDVTRTILPVGGKVSKDLWDLWHVVHNAQTAGFDLMHANQTCSDVDAASRKVVDAVGLGPYYTHRLGHGLGLEMHEHPYLNGANSEKLSLGEVATNEPGIYVTAEQASAIGREVGFGIRLEDPILVTPGGGEPLTGRRAISPYEP